MEPAGRGSIRKKGLGNKPTNPPGYMETSQELRFRADSNQDKTGGAGPARAAGGSEASWMEERAFSPELEQAE